MYVEEIVGIGKRGGLSDRSIRQERRREGRGWKEMETNELVGLTARSLNNA
jgi:hypothetical protein